MCIPDNLVFPLYFPVLSISGWISGRRGKWCAGTRIGRWSHVGKRWLLHRVAFSFCASSHTKAARSLHSTGVSLLCSEPSFLVPTHHRCLTHDKNDTNTKVSFVTPGEPSIGTVLFRIAQDAQRQQSRGRTTNLIHPLHLSASHLANRRPSDGQRQRLWDTPLWLAEPRRWCSISHRQHRFYRKI